MDANDWKHLVVEEARNVSDRNYQERAWFGGADYISSPEELYCRLFDDFLFGDFLSDQRVALNDDQREAGFVLKAALEHYPLEEGCDPKNVFDDPRWEVVRYAAKAFVRTMENGSIRPDHACR